MDRRRQGGVQQEEQTVIQTEEMIPENKSLTVRPSTVDGELLRWQKKKSVVIHIVMTYYVYEGVDQYDKNQHSAG